MGAVNQIVQSVSNEVQHISDVVSNDPNAKTAATLAALAGAAYLTGGSSVSLAEGAMPAAEAAAAPAAAPIAEGAVASAIPTGAAVTGTPLAQLATSGAMADGIPRVEISGGLPDAASFHQAVASGMSPGSVGAYESSAVPGAGMLNPEQLSAAYGTTGAGSAVNGLATAGNASALTDMLGQGTSGLANMLGNAGSAIGNTLGNLSGTQLGALGTGAAGLYNASATRQAMQDAIGAQQAATSASQNTLGNIYNQQLGYQAPYQAAGVGAVNQLAGMNPYLTHQFNAADLQAGLAPNYDFMLQQGQQANQRAANVGGGALGGNALTGLNKYTQDYAGNAYQNAFNNYQSQRQNIYSDLAGIAGIGQTANTGAGTAGTNYAQGTVGLNTGLANAQAANMLGQAQVGAGGITNAANTAFLATLLGQGTPSTGNQPSPPTASSGGSSLSDILKMVPAVGNISNAWTGLQSIFK